MPMLIHCPSVSVSCALRGKSAQVMANVNNNLFITLFHLSAAKVRVCAGFSVTTFSYHMFIFSVSLREWINNVCPTFSTRYAIRGLLACKRPPFTLRLTAFCVAKGRISHLHRINARSKRTLLCIKPTKYSSSRLKTRLRLNGAIFITKVNGS